MQRNALRDSDVKTLIRIVREQRENGLGPEEAFAIAKKAIPDAADEVFKGWKKFVIEKAQEPGEAPANRVNLATRAHSLEADNAALRRSLSDLGAQLENARGGGAEAAGLREALVDAEKRIERLNSDLTALRKEHEAALELINDKPKTVHKK